MGETRVDANLFNADNRFEIIRSSRFALNFKLRAHIVARNDPNARITSALVKYFQSGYRYIFESFL